MFKRRTPLTTSQKLREMIWPSMGFRRGSRYILHRLLRIKDSNHSIALGLSLGVVVSFIPLPGTHIIQAALLAWLLRSSVLASFIGTLFGNPLTLPLMWWAAYKVGETGFEALGFEVSTMPDSLNFSVAEITKDFIGLFLPWVVGGYILMLASFPPVYAAIFWIVSTARKRKIKWQQDRMHEIAATLTDPQGKTS